MQPLRGSQCSPFLWGDYRRLAFRRRGRLLSWLAQRNPSAVAGLALRSPFLRGDYRRRAFRRRDACSPGCAAFALPLGSQARTPALFAEQSAFGGCQAALRSPFLWGRRRGRLLSGLRSALPSSGVAGETPALFAEQSAFGGCQASAAFTLPLGSLARRLRSLRSKAPSAVAGLRSVPFGGCRAALRSPLPLTSYLLPLTFYLLPFTSYLLPLTSYLLPLTSYLLPLTSYLLPLTSYLLPLTFYLLPLTSYLLFRFRSRRRRGLRGGRR